MRVGSVPAQVCDSHVLEDIRVAEVTISFSESKLTREVKKKPQPQCFFKTHFPLFWTVSKILKASSNYLDAKIPSIRSVN